MYGKKCTGCDFVFTLVSKPHKELTGKCPQCGAEVNLAEAKALPEQPAAKQTTTEEGK
jgi:rRNA maturation endonuclease Nob1